MMNIRQRDIRKSINFNQRLRRADLGLSIMNLDRIDLSESKSCKYRLNDIRGIIK